MKIKIEIDLDNSAFVDELGSGFFNASELSRIFRKVSKQLEGRIRDDIDGDYGNCFDCNGNKVGRWEIS